MNRNTLVALIAIIAIGAALRLYNIGFQPLQCDEAYTLNVAKMPLYDLILFIVLTDFTPPIYYVVAHFSYIAGGFADVAIWYPSIVFGVLQIPAMFYLGKMIRFETSKNDGDTIGLVSAAITAILFPMIYYSQFARAYTMWIFFITVFFAMFVYIRATTRSNIDDLNAPFEDYTLLGILGAFCVWCHLFTIIPVAVTLLSLFVTTKRKNFMGAATTFFISILALIPVFIRTKDNRDVPIEQGMHLYSLTVYTPFEFFSAAFPLFFALIIGGVWAERKNTIMTELLAISVFSIAIGIFVSFFNAVFSRYFYFVLPIFIVVSACAISSLLTNVKKDYLKPVIIILFIVCVFLLQWNAIQTHYDLLRMSC